MSSDELTEQQFWEILAAMPEPAKIFYRLYHDDQGRPLFYSMEDVPGNYIEITQQQYAASDPMVIVKNGKLFVLKSSTVQKLEPTDTGTPCHPYNVAIVVTSDQEHQCWSKQVYEQS